MVGVDEPGRHRLPLAGRRAVPDGGQDRHGAGVHASARTRSTASREVAERLRDHALFIAFAPADAPKLAVAVLVENGRSGSGTAAPIARKVFDAYLAAARGGGRHAAAPKPAPRRPQEAPRNEDRHRRPGLLEPRAAHLHADRPRCSTPCTSTGRCCSSVLAVCVAGLVVLFSAAGEDVRRVPRPGGARRPRRSGVLTFVAQIPPRVLRIGAAVPVRRRRAAAGRRGAGRRRRRWARSAGSTSASSASSRRRS